MLLTLLSPQGAPANVVANLAATLGAATLASTATVFIQPVTADLSVILGAATLASTATISGAAVAGYGVGGSNITDAFPIVGVVGVPPPVQAIVRQTH